MKPDTERIHVNNGYIELDDEEEKAPVFVPKVEYCRNRLNIDYSPEIWNGAYYPEKSLSFLCDLLEPQDISTLQEYLGYCMVAITKGQVMMSIIDSGGNGSKEIPKNITSNMSQTFLTAQVGSEGLQESVRTVSYKIQQTCPKTRQLV